MQIVYETICIKYQNLFSGKNLRSFKIPSDDLSVPNMLSVNEQDGFDL